MNVNIIYIVVSVVFIVFFSGIEIAYLNLNKVRFELDKKRGLFASKIILLLIKNPVNFSATMLFGIIASLVSFVFLMTVQLKPLFDSLSINSEFVIHIILFSISVIIFLFAGELLPRAFFTINPNKIFNIFAIPVSIIYVILYPIVKLTTILAIALLKLFKLNFNPTKDKIVFGAIDPGNIVEQGVDVDETEAEMEHDIRLFQNALDFSKVKLRECTIPRNEIAAIEISSPVEKLKEKFIETGYSKILIYRETIDHIIGYAQSSDLFQKPEKISLMLKNLIIAPETMPANKLLNLFMKEHKSIALIVDEFGGTAGIVTIEDIMEEIFGEIEDEHDSSDFKEEKISETEFIFSGRLEIDYINEKFDLNLPESEDYETIAGYILHHHEEIPNENDKIFIHHYELEILKMHNPKIELVKIKLLPKK